MVVGVPTFLLFSLHRATSRWLSTFFLSSRRLPYVIYLWCVYDREGAGRSAPHVHSHQLSLHRMPRMPVGWESAVARGATGCTVGSAYDATGPTSAKSMKTVCLWISQALLSKTHMVGAGKI